MRVGTGQAYTPKRTTPTDRSVSNTAAAVWKRERRRADPEYAERDREKARRWKAENPEKVRAWERSHAGTCPGCGARMARGSLLCRLCRREQQRDRRRRIAELWRAGATLKQIAAELETSAASINTAVVLMRRAGWDMPRRRGQTLKMHELQPATGESTP